MKIKTLADFQCTFNLNRKKSLKRALFYRSATSNCLVAKLYSIEEFEISVLSNLESLLSTELAFAQVFRHFGSRCLC